MTRKRIQPARRLPSEEKLYDDSNTTMSWSVNTFTFVFDVIVKGLIIVKPILSLFVAIYIIKSLMSYGRKFTLDLVCPMVPSPFLSLVPGCAHWNDPVPDFSQLVAVQEKLYNTMMQHDPSRRTTFGTNNADQLSYDDPVAPLTALSLKQVELATRDLQLMIKHSRLVYKDILTTKLGDYLLHSREFGRDIQSMQAQSKGVIDNLITYNTVTLRKLSDVERGSSSRQELRAIYEGSMELIEKEARRLILAIEVAQGSLQILETDLYAISEITIQERSYQRSEEPDILADLVNMVNGKGMQRSLVQENLALLRDYDVERMKSSQRLMVLLDRMEAVQMDLEELRTQVVAPILVADSLPLEMHIENINKAIDRLKSGKLSTWEGTSHRVQPDTLVLSSPSDEPPQST